ncbi:MAG: hypothetical protein COA47_07485 [Robiginitomaculum sp.]|nr:MAG: hypothetical protein COA47_07485 [Robiginitomaculum sp.]
MILRFKFENHRPEATIPDDLKEFEARLRKAQRSRIGDTPEQSAPPSSSGLRHGLEFVSGVLAGALLGWFVDRLFGTAPFGLIFFMLLGFASGLLSAVRSAKRAELDADALGNDPGNSADDES